MFDFLEGRVEAVRAGGLVLRTGGLGWSLAATAGTLERLRPGEEARLLVHLAVSDSALSLFGFLDEAERGAFRRLIQVSGIGPSLALSLLTALPPRDLAEAIRRRDAAALTRVKGIGRKTAERLLVEIGDGLAAWEEPGAAAAGDGPDELVQLLVDLGTRPAEARTAAARARAALGPEAELEDLLRHALQPHS